MNHEQHFRFERKIAKDFICQISDLDHLINAPTPNVHTVYCKNGKKRVLNLDQAT
jgi:hypothetical protein